MKNQLKHLLFVFVSLLLVLIVPAPFSSCQKGNSAKDAEIDSITMLKADSLIKVAYATKNKDTIFALLDSLETVGDIGPVRGAFERGLISGYLNERFAQKEYWKKALQLKIRNRIEEKYYFRLVAYLANALQSDHDFEGALRLSLDALEKMKQSKECGPRNIAIHLTDIGICQLKMRRFDDASKSFRESFDYFDKAIASDTGMVSMENAIICNSNIVLFYLDARHFNEALTWENHIDGLLDEYQKNPKHAAYFHDRQYTRNLNFKARVLYGLGRMDKANEFFQEYQNAELYKKGVEHAPGEFLMQAKRYAEATEAYSDIEDVIRQRVGKPSLDIVQQYMFPKFRANVGAGYKDSALAVGTRILNALDSAIVWQKQDDAAELATIYQTQEKDRQIAQQELTLSKMRFQTSAIVFGLIIIAFLVFIYYRHRAAKRLAEVKAAQERIESELRIARDIQMSMVPSKFPEREGLDLYASMNPAKEVGGDLYGYVVKGDYLYFIVGDVSGKGVPASLFMAQATRLFHTMATQGMLPADICNHMNAELSGEDNVNGMFVTLFIGMLDMESGHLKFCNAGHNPPVLGGGENQGELLEMIANAPIGLWPELEYKGEEIDSIKGRALFIYTDGLNEAEDAEQKQFGEERMLSILRNTHFDSARQVVDTLLAKVEEHRAGAEPNDDLTMLCLRVS